MWKIQKRVTFISIVVVLLFSFVLSLSSQEAAKKTVVCPKCGYINDWSNDFCMNCGVSLKDAKLEAEKKAKEAERVKALEEAEIQEKKKPVVKIYEGPIDPRRLFIIPVADVLSSLEINIGGGSAFGVRKTEERPYLGHVRIGLGDVAEVEISTVGIINRLSEGSAAIPTAAFKLKFIPEGKVRPAFAGAIRSSLWHTEDRDTVKFQKRVATLYFVASKTFGALSFHLGASISDLRIRTRHKITDEFISPTRQWEQEHDRDYYNRNLVGPFFGFRAEVNPRTMLMLEVEQIAEYDFDEDNPILSKDDISTEWMMIAGVRFFFFNWLALDTGVMYRSDYHGIGDTQIEAGLNINLPLPRIARAIRSR